MPPGRNDPCPCGSGRKYKHCCGQSRGASPGPDPSPHLPPEVLERARKADTWEADLVAVPASIAGRERFRTVAPMVVAGDMVVGTDILSVTSAEPEEVAGALEAAVAKAATTVGVWPATLIVRREAVAGFLRPLLHPRGCLVMVAPVLRELDPAAAELAFEIAGADTWPALAPPETWAAWGLPEAMVASLFRAYAAFYRAAPWRWFDDFPPVLAEWEDGTGPWTVSVMGAGMGEFGLAVYSEREDLEGLLDAPGDEGYEDEGYEEDAVFFDHEDEGIGSDGRWRENPFRNLRGWVVHLGYIHRQELPRAMVKEISQAQWEVEALAAYPYISPVLTPGGGLQRALAGRLAELLLGVAALSEKHGSRLRAPQGGIFTWTEGGLTLRYLNPPVDAPATGPLPPDLEEMLEEIRERDFGSMEELQAEMQRRVDEVNAIPQEELAGISPNQALELMRGAFDEGSPLQLSEALSAEELEGSAFLANARTLLTAVEETDGTPATAAGNLKRTFVAEMVARMRFEEGYLDLLLRGNKVVNEQDIGTLHVLRVNLEVGGLLKRRKGRFTLTRKGRELAKPDQVGRLFVHLFRTYFGKFNMAYGSWSGDGAALQRAVPILLWQIGARAREWISLRDLAVQILPRRPGMPPPEDSPQWWQEESELHSWVLRPLTQFGLLEKRYIGPGDIWHRGSQETQFRATPLFGAFLRFEW